MDDVFLVFPVAWRLMSERATGIEPAYLAWEASALPLSYARVAFWPFGRTSLCTSSLAKAGLAGGCGLLNNLIELNADCFEVPHCVGVVPVGAECFRPRQVISQEGG